jgi:hypothetical protein
VSARPELKGARLSSAVRCIARAEHEALGTPRDEHATEFLDDYFVRGVAVGKAWVREQKALTKAAGKTLIEECAIPWGPKEYGWEGHADAVILEDQLVIEAYHAKGGDFRRNKALQAAAYATQLGPEWRAMLAVLDSSDIDEDEGFRVTLIPLEVSELKPETDAIIARVTAAVAEGVWNPDDRVADHPGDNECRHCPFRGPCWAGWEPPAPDFVPELDDDAALLLRLQSDRAHLKVQLDQLDERVRIMRDALRPFTRPGVPLVAGGASIKRIEIKPRRTFSFSAYEGAGHLVTPTMREFIKESPDTGERWYVGKAT